MASVVVKDDSETAIVFDADAWSVATNLSYYKSSAHITTVPLASLSFSFSGQQVSILGSSTGPYRVILDGQRTWSFSRSPSRSSRLFSTRGLEDSVHELTLVHTGVVGQELVVDGIRLASSPTSTPLLLPPPTISTSSRTLPSVASSSTTPSFASSSSFATSIRPRASEPTDDAYTASSTFTGSDIDSENTSGAIVAGSVVGSLIGVVALGLLLFVFLRRCRRRRSNDDNRRWPGKPTLIGATPFPNGQGGIGGYPRDMSQLANERVHPTAKATEDERLPATKSFYKVDSPRDREAARPQLKVTWAGTDSPLPTDSTRPFALLHPILEPKSPRSLVISKPTRPVPAAHNSPRRTGPPNTLPLPLNSLPGWNPLPQTRSNRHAGLAAQPPKRDRITAGRRDTSRRGQGSEDALLVIETVEGDVGEEGRFGDENRAAFFQTRSVMPKYSQDRGDPRLR